MKKIQYLLLVMLATFMSVTNVNADSITLTDPLECFSIAPASSTKNIFLNNWGTEDKICGYVNKTFYQWSNVGNGSIYPCINNFIEIQPNTTYTFSHFNSSFEPVDSPKNNHIIIFDSDFKQISSTQSFFEPPYNFTAPENAKYFLYCANYVPFPYTLNNIASLNTQLEANEITSSDDLTFAEYQEYIAPPDEPDKPDVIIPDSTLNDYYSLFTTKLQFLGEFALENKFVLSAITIILVLVCLELFIYLFKGGRRR